MAIKRAKEPVVLTQPPPAAAPFSVPLEPAILIARSMELKRLVQIFLNGAHSLLPGGRPFLPHQGLLMTMRRAYDLGNAEVFVTTVEKYLTQAVTQLPQAGTRDDIPGHVQALRTLIEQAGFPLVAQRILSVISAPL